VSFADVYRLTVVATTTVQIDMTTTLGATVLDPYLFLLNDSFQSLAQDDDSGGGTSSRITRTLAAGTYYILATTFSPGQTGTYSLSVRVP
jgi:hypothetical protein